MRSELIKYRGLCYTLSTVGFILPCLTLSLQAVMSTEGWTSLSNITIVMGKGSLLVTRSSYYSTGYTTVWLFTYWHSFQLTEYCFHFLIEIASLVFFMGFLIYSKSSVP